jgi:hypothetical protein
MTLVKGGALKRHPRDFREGVRRDEVESTWVALLSVYKRHRSNRKIS